MSSVHKDKGWLLVSFMMRSGVHSTRVRLYPGIRATRDGERSPTIKEIRKLIEMQRWAELAERFPKCKQLTPFRPALSRVDATTFRQASDRFLAYQSNANSEATVNFYLTILKSHIWPASEFADKPLRLIGASDVTALFGPLRHRGYQAQAANVRRVVSAVFNWARGERGKDGEYLVMDNPVNRTKPIKIDREEEDIDPFTSKEIQQIINSAPPGWQRYVVIVAFGTGLRPNENFGLKRTNVDLDARIIRVRQTFSRFGEGGLKTPRSRRDVDISEPVLRALRNQLAEGHSHGPWLWPISQLRPRPHSPQQFSSKEWPAILKRAEVRHREFYQCRHSFATMLLSAGADWRYIADQMGHSDLTMLQKHYWKWRPGSVPKPLLDPFNDVLSI
jgi:integrase